MAALLQRHFVVLSIGTALLFVLTMLMAASGSRTLLTSATIRQATAGVSTLAMMRLMSTEIPALGQTVKAPSMRQTASVNSFLFRMLTGVHPGDLRNVIARELPGFATYASLEAAAIGGAAATELLVESPAPLAVSGEPAAGAESPRQDQEPATPAPASPSEMKNVVFIYHTHNRESWLNVTKQTHNSVDHPQKNITLVGQRLAEALKEKGIGSEANTEDIYQRLLDSGKRYPLAYAESLKVVQAAVERNRDIRYLFDIHRDANLAREKTTAVIEGKSYARILFVIGTRNKNYRQNLELAQELHALIEKKYPGLSRGIDDKGGSEGHGEYNQSVSPGSLLIEVGGVHNTLEECYNTAEAFADVFAEYYWQAERASAEAGSPAAKR